MSPRSRTSTMVKYGRYNRDVTQPNAADAGTIKIGGDLEINRLGFGAMRITGPGITGPPPNMPAARETLRALRDLGVNFVDTSNAYGPAGSELRVPQAPHPD